MNECKPKVIRAYKEFICDEEYSMNFNFNCEECDKCECKYWKEWWEE